MKPSFPLHRKLFVSHFLSTLLVASFLGLFVYYMAKESLMEQLRLRLSSSAAMVSREIDADRLRDIRFERDVSKRDYVETLRSLRQMSDSSEDIAFLYVMRLDADGVVRFVVDSDESEEQALPGREYVSVNEALLRGFEEPAADRDFTTDAWGTFVSGYAPILNGDGEFLVGIDMRADEAKRKLAGIQVAAGAGLLVALVVSWLVAGLLSRHFKKPLDAMIAQCQAVGAGQLDQEMDLRRNDEMETLLVAINDMTGDLRRAREAKLQLAESLDDPVGKRPAD